MKLALVNGIRTEPTPSARGKCYFCGHDMISKCGEYILWHWAHKSRFACDSWHKSETVWHRYWKDVFPLDCQEIVHDDDANGEKHIADVKTPTGVIVEVQHSPIAVEEMRSREKFYEKMIWIVDARHLCEWFFLGMSHDLVCCCPMMYRIKWWSRSMLLDKWSLSLVPVYFDIATPRIYQGDEDGMLWFLPHKAEIPLQERVLWRLLDFNTDDRLGHIAPVQADVIVEAAMNGELPPPLHKCEEEDAWRYRRELSAAEHIDHDKTKRPMPSQLDPSIDPEQSRNSNIPIDDDELPF